MNPSDFKSKEAGACVMTLGGYWAFMPNPPPPLTFDADTVIALSEADTALGEVAGLALGGAIPRMHLLIQTFKQREALLSSRIEGTQTQFDELLLAQVQEPQAAGEGDLREV